ncbi:unnamed protein product [Didymodactylos carnosus]|uniref:Receptor ligand binding region domain-containing protein n=1 Tax=Didymodactylos carnosus TaxID=1234261 RepID=A0A8S2IZV7_9BILA|nr:unnamed protein product [Didymodactylos carnosus]CAF3784879.1 unnamed protein product [Didymodactylos carnosus]
MMSTKTYFITLVLLFLLKITHTADLQIKDSCSSVQLLGLFPKDMKNEVRQSVEWSIARSMFEVAILLARIYNMTFDGQCLGWQEVIAENEMSVMLTICEKLASNNIVGIIGPAASNDVRVISSFPSLLNIPMASYSATNPDRSDITVNEAFYRVVLSDRFAAFAISKLFQQFKWSSVSVIIQNDDYGYGGLKVLKDEFYSTSVHIINELDFEKKTDDFTAHDNWAEILSKSSSRIVLVWANENVTYSILKHALKENMTTSDFVWILTNEAPIDLFNQSEKKRLVGILAVIPVPGALVGVAVNSSLLADAEKICYEMNHQPCSVNNEVNNYALFAFDATWALILALHQHCSQNNHCLDFEKNVTNCFGVRYSSGTYYREILRESTNFLGVTGPVEFSNNSTDRLKGAYYLLKNLQIIGKTNGYSYVPAMNWSDTGTWKLAEIMGFTYEIQVAGSTVIYNDLVCYVHNNAYHMAVADLTITSKRTDLVDFSTTFLENALRVVVRTSGTAGLSIFSYFRPFSRYLWLAFFGIIVYSGISI